MHSQVEVQPDGHPVNSEGCGHQWQMRDSLITCRERELIVRSQCRHTHQSGKVLQLCPSSHQAEVRSTSSPSLHKPWALLMRTPLPSQTCKPARRLQYSSTSDRHVALHWQHTCVVLWQHGVAGRQSKSPNASTNSIHVLWCTTGIHRQSLTELACHHLHLCTGQLQ